MTFVRPVLSARSGPLPGIGVPRRHYQPCRYDAFVPDPLVGHEVLLPIDVAGGISDAESAVQHFKACGLPCRGYEAIVHLLLRAEAVASSRIKDLEIGGRRLGRRRSTTVERLRSLRNRASIFTRASPRTDRRGE